MFLLFLKVSITFHYISIANFGVKCASCSRSHVQVGVATSKLNLKPTDFFKSLNKYSFAIEVVRANFSVNSQFSFFKHCRPCKFGFSESLLGNTQQQKSLKKAKDNQSFLTCLLHEALLILNSAGKCLNSLWQNFSATGSIPCSGKTSLSHKKISVTVQKESLFPAI